MNRGKIYKIIIIIQFLIGFHGLYAQEQSDSIVIDSAYVFMDNVNYLNLYNTKWVTIGSQYEFCGSTFGLLISNGYDESPLIHFEDFSEDIIFKLRGHTDFNKSYSFRTKLGWEYPIRYLSKVSLGFDQYDYSKSDLYYRDFNVSAEKFISKLALRFILKIAYQTLNDFENIGVNLGIQKVIFYRRLYTGLSVGYYSDYFTYSAYLHGFVYKDIVGMRIEYEKVDKYDFLMMGLNFTFNR